MPERSPVRIALGALFAVICALAIALALGAVWMALTLHVPSAAWWFALPAGVAMGLATRAWVTASRVPALLLAAGGTWLAAIYMQCLFTGLRLAAIMGLGYFTTLRKAGIGMLWALSDWGTRLLASCLVGMVLAILVVAVKRRRAS